MCLNYAVIDIGSNTMRLSVYSCRGGHVSVLFTKKETAGLAGYVTDGAMTVSYTHLDVYKRQQQTSIKADLLHRSAFTV